MTPSLEHTLLKKQLVFTAQPNQSTIDSEIKSYVSNLENKSFNVLTATQGEPSITPNKRIAVCFSGGPAPGGHNVVYALAELCHEGHTLYGINGGPGGLLKGDLFELTLDTCNDYLNVGGFHLLKTDRTKIKSAEQFEQVKHVVRQYKLDGLIIIGGDDSNTNAVLLANELISENCSVIGVPKTIDGDLTSPPYLPVSFGFHSACDTYAAMVTALIRDTHSSQKYWHIVKLMGRSASHITKQVAKQTNPDLFFIGEYLSRDNITLSQVIDTIAEHILKSNKNSKNFGVVLLPEGLLEWTPDVKALIAELNTVLSHDLVTIDTVVAKLNPNNASLFKSFPEYIQQQLLMDRDSHGNVQLSRIETERLVIDMLTTVLAEKNSSYKFDALPHFYGYEGRCCDPNAFDADFCLQLGYIAGQLALQGFTGYMAACDGTRQDNKCYGVPIASLLNMEQRHGKKSPVIEKTVVR